jgi:hypothetical protein
MHECPKDSITKRQPVRLMVEIAEPPVSFIFFGITDCNYCERPEN